MNINLLVLFLLTGYSINAYAFAESEECYYSNSFGIVRVTPRPTRPQSTEPKFIKPWANSGQVQLNDWRNFSRNFDRTKNRFPKVPEIPVLRSKSECNKRTEGLECLFVQKGMSLADLAQKMDESLEHKEDWSLIANEIQQVVAKKTGEERKRYLQRIAPWAKSHEQVRAALSFYDNGDLKEIME